MKLRSGLRTGRQPCLPDDLIVEIIRKLPVKYILRFRSVNKSWYDFISTSSFIKYTISDTKNNDDYLLWTYSNCYTLKDLSQGEEDKFDRVKYYYPPESFGVMSRNCYPNDEEVKVYGICNGLLCVSNSDMVGIITRIYLWNPIIRKIKKISEIGLNSDEVGYDGDLCFGYFNDDYKVIRLARFCSRGSSKYCVGVYSLSTDAWKFTYCGSDSDTHSLMCNPSFNRCVGGVAYFGVANLADSTCKLLCFDLHHERITELQFPDKFGSQLAPYSRDPKYTFSVVSCGESIALIQIMEEHLTRWVLRKCAATNTSTWDIIVTIKLKTPKYYKLLGFTKHCKYMLMVDGKYYYLWDIGTPQLEECTPDTETNLKAVDHLSGNLVLLNEETLNPYVEI